MANLPTVVDRCETCFTNVFDASQNHSCRSTMKTTSPDIYVKSPYKLFEFEVDGQVYVFNQKTKRMRLFQNGQKLLSSATQSVIYIKTSGSTHTVAYESCAIKRCRIIFAAMSNNEWRMVYQIEVSEHDCVRLTELNVKLSEENEFLTLYVSLPMKAGSSTVIILTGTLLSFWLATQHK